MQEAKHASYRSASSSWTRRAALGLGLSATFGCTGGARGTTSLPFSLPGAYTIPFRSQINGIAYEVHVSATGAERDETLPLVITLDADYQFAIAASHLQHLADRGQIPRVLLASIGYAGQYPDRARYQLNRTRDYTPVNWPDGHYSPEAQAVSGGAPLFSRVIAEEIIPLIARQRPTTRDDTTIIGHSYGGLFGAWLLCTQPRLFRRYLLISPSLWYADGLVLNLARSPTTSSRELDLFVGVGSQEEQANAGRRMVSDAQMLCDTLSTRPLLNTTFRVFEGENHASIFPAAFSAGIRRLLPVG
jgi:uncharacterized protein